MAKPLKGNTYECLKTTKDMGPYKNEYFTKGKIYPCEVEGCLTDNEGDKHHRWDDDEFLGKHTFSRTFKLHTLDKRNTPYSDLLNMLNKAGVKDLFIPELNPYMGSTNWMMIIHVHEDDYKIIVQPQHLEGIDTPEEDESIGLIRLLSDTGDDIDFNYWFPAMIMVDGIVTHISSTEFNFGGNGIFDPVDLDDCTPDTTYDDRDVNEDWND